MFSGSEAKSKALPLTKPALPLLNFTHGKILDHMKSDCLSSPSSHPSPVAASQQPILCDGHPGEKGRLQYLVGFLGGQRSRSSLQWEEENKQEKKGLMKLNCPSFMRLDVCALRLHYPTKSTAISNASISGSFLDL